MVEHSFINLAKKLSIASAGITLGLASLSLPSRAQAAQLFKFNYSFAGDIPVSAAGTLTTTDLNPVDNSYTIIGITGTRTVGGITENILSLLGVNTFYGNDNLLYAQPPFLSYDGFAFKVDGLGNDDKGNVLVYDEGEGDYTEDSLNVDYGSFNVTPVPEPTTIASTIAVGTGLIMSLYKKRKLQKALREN